MTRPTLPPLTWLVLTPEELGRWSWEQHVRWPMPLDSSRVGRWEPELEELLAGLEPEEAGRPRGEERLLATLADILPAQEYCTFAIRSVGGEETHLAGLSRGADVVVVVDPQGETMIGRRNSTVEAVAARNSGTDPTTTPTTMPATTAIDRPVIQVRSVWPNAVQNASWRTSS